LVRKLTFCALFSSLLFLSSFNLDDVSEEASKEKEVAVEKLCELYVKEK